VRLEEEVVIMIRNKKRKYR